MKNLQSNYLLKQPFFPHSPTSKLLKGHESGLYSSRPSSTFQALKIFLEQKDERETAL